MNKILPVLTIILLFFGMGLQAQSKDKPASTENKYEPIHLTDKTFKDLIFDYTASENWDYKGDVPCIVDFYADWCSPCKMIAPILANLSKEYKGKVVVYKVDTQHNREVASAFNITSIPRVLFIPVKGEPSMVTGARAKEFYKAQMDKLLEDSKK